MKRAILLSLGVCLSFPALFAQTSDIILFSDAGEKFTLAIDGSVVNEQPAARVVARGVRNATPLLVVQFADAGIPSLKQNGWMEPGMEYTLRITTNKKGVRVLRMQGQAPLGTTADNPAEKPAPANFRDDAPASTEAVAPAVTPAVASEVVATDPVTGQTIQQTTTVTTTDGTPGGNVSFNVDVNGVGMNMTIHDGMTGSTTTTTTTTQQTTTRITEPAAPAPVVTDEPVVAATGCGSPMSAADFAEAKASIGSKGFDETKLTLAKQIAGSNCLSTAQVVAVMGLFGFEDSKLDFAKFAYDHVADRGNYYKVNDAFSFSGSVDELNDYIQGR